MYVRVYTWSIEPEDFLAAAPDGRTLGCSFVMLATWGWILSQWQRLGEDFRSSRQSWICQKWVKSFGAFRSAKCKETAFCCLRDIGDLSRDEILCLSWNISYESVFRYLFLEAVWSISLKRSLQNTVDLLQDEIQSYFFFIARGVLDNLFPCALILFKVFVVEHSGFIARVEFRIVFREIINLSRDISVCCFWIWFIFFNVLTLIGFYQLRQTQTKGVANKYFVRGWSNFQL